MTDYLSDECLVELSADLKVKMMDCLWASSLVEQMALLMAASLTEESDEMMVKMTADLKVWSLVEQKDDMKEMMLGC